MLTRSGLGAALTAVALAICGAWWRYEELVVAAICIGVTIALALWSARVPHRARIIRSITTPRTARGDPIRLVYRATNPSRRRSPPAVIVDCCDDAETRVDLPPIARDDRTEVTGSIATRRRGVFPVGPLTVERVDPFGLAIGQRAVPAEAVVLVHPRVHPLHGPYGAMHTVEDEAVIRKAASDPLSGFVSLREYVDGDDPRLIHWPTSARMGTLMLREHVELRRPEFTVVLDAAAAVSNARDFEEMVDVAASVAVHALRSGVDVTVRTTSRAFPGSVRPIEHETHVLDLLTPVEQTSAEHLSSLPEIFHSGIDHTTIVFVTGARGPSSTLTHTDKLSVIRIGEGAAATSGVTLAARDAAEFVQRWRP
ncbi:MAG: DUF58 domain-containing protein [Ilumatobacter sp.]|uniref:DUF58 domain-containing protein n=1 Tax=Ilumatobacter sp. TaxID=1967498 RepID=UPI00262A5394|nr:DUF58 domain-containing protein [Ilumatobacter sp.]MDJ0768197.1 DUF58 domain-containing protein [Ilumatobacter sp.]